MKWHIGCSGFHYREWKEFFYPPKLPQRRWFEHYSRFFSTLEINASFYRFPQLSMLQNWYNLSPADFIFTVKAPQSITHYKQFHDCQQLLDDLYKVCYEGLKEKFGCLLFQFPPRFSYTEEKLQRILKNLDKSARNVLEFRHNGWWNTLVYDELRKNNVIFCGSSMPGLPDTPIITSETAYYRFHGIPELYRSVYSEEDIQKVAGVIRLNDHIKEVFCYFNNTAGVGAISNAQWLLTHASGIPIS